MSKRQDDRELWRELKRVYHSYVTNDIATCDSTISRIILGWLDGHKIKKRLEDELDAKG